MIIATAGHVDHGKTTLVKALTGTNTDNLPEEKKRGLTIDLGFAYLNTNTGQTLAFVDVPGHEKFVRNAIAGVGLADVALLVIAADDGPMPQTLEHLAILNLLGVRKVVPVITKIDLVSSERLAEVSKQIPELFPTREERQQSALEIFTVSNSDKASVSKILQHILQLTSDVPPHRLSGNFRMAIDRCFTLEGSGTVVTGTVASGQVSEEDTITLVSNNSQTGKSARIRSLHTQNAKAQLGKFGQRCALNLTGELTKSNLVRGSWLVGNKNFEPTSQLDVIVELAPHRDAYGTGKQSEIKPRPLKHWTPAHLHIGTADIPCRIALLEGSTLEHGQPSLARLICDKPSASVHGDRFILRDQSARQTIAGGVVLDPHPPKRGRSKPQRLLELRALDEPTPAKALANLAELATSGINLNELAHIFDLSSGELSKISSELNLHVVQSGHESWVLTSEHVKRFKHAIKECLRTLHRESPDQPGADVTLVKSLVGVKAETQLVEVLLRELQQEQLVSRSGSVFFLAGHKVAMSEGDQTLWQIVGDKLQTAELVPPRLNEIATTLDITPAETVSFLNRCVSHGKLYKVTDNRYFLPQTLKQLAQIAEKLAQDNALTVAEFRNQSGVGRNLVVELLEYFDRTRFTQRIDDKRRVLARVEEKFQ